MALTESDYKAISDKIIQNFRNVGINNVQVVVWNQAENGTFDARNLDRSDLAIGLGDPIDCQQFAFANLADKSQYSIEGFDKFEGNHTKKYESDEHNQGGYMKIVANPERTEKATPANNYSGRISVVDISDGQGGKLKVGKAPLDDANLTGNNAATDYIANAASHGALVHSPRLIPNSFNHGSPHDQGSSPNLSSHSFTANKPGTSNSYFSTQGQIGKDNLTIGSNASAQKYNETKSDNYKTNYGNRQRK